MRRKLLSVTVNDTIVANVNATPSLIFRVARF